MALPTSSTPIAKSLHTLTVIQQVTTAIAGLDESYTLPEALETALRVLGLAGRPDPYGLAARALVLLTGAKA
jgi:hypothetical protein